MPVMHDILASEATAAQRRLYFHLVDATDGITPETGEAGGQPQISKAGAAWTNTGIGVLSAIGNGRYYAELTQATIATTGDIFLSRYKSANTAECPGDLARIVSYDPYDLPSMTIANVTDVGTVGDVTTKTGYSLAADQSAVTIGNVVDVGTTNKVTTKTGFSLAADQSAVTIGTVVDVGTTNKVTTKTGFSLAADQSAVTIGNVVDVGTVQTVSNLAAATANITTVKNILEGDYFVNTSPDPWQVEIRTAGTGTAIVTKNVFDTAGANVTDNSTVVGRLTQP